MRKVKFKIVLIAALIFTLSLIISACGISSSAPLAKLDLSNATNLFIAPYSSRSNGASAKLFKITAGGFVEEVTYYDEDGNETSVIEAPAVVYNVNDDYVIVCFGSDEYNIESGYIVKKSDGIVYSLDSVGFPQKQINHYINVKHVFFDSNDYIYYLRDSLEEGSTGRSDHELVRIDASDPGNLTGSLFSPSLEHIYNFEVDMGGNAIYTGRLKSETPGTVSIYRILKGNGGLYNLPNDVINFWLGVDDNIYYHSSDQITQVEISDSFDVAESDYGTQIFLGSPSASYKLVLTDSIILLNTSPGNIFEVNNPAGDPGEVSLSGLLFQQIRDVAASGAFYYIAGIGSNSESVLARVDPSDHSYIHLITPGEYDVYAVTVSENDTVTINALRLSDGKVIIAEIDASGTLTILDEELNSEVVVLERIN